MSLNEEFLDIRSFDIAHGTGRASGSGRWESGAVRPCRLEMKTEGVELRGLLPIFEIEADIDGRLFGQLSLGEDEQGLRGSGQLSVVGGQAWGEPFEEASALIGIERGEVRLAPCELFGRSVGGKGELVWNLEEESAVMALEEGFLDLQFLEMVRSRDLSLSGKVELSGFAHWSSGLLDGSVKVEGTDLDLLGQQLKGIAGEIHFENENASAVMHGIGEAGWELQATLGMTEEFPVSASLRLEQSVFDPFKERNPPLWAKISGSVEVQGSLVRPEEMAADGVVTHGEIFLGAHPLILTETLPIRLRSQLLYLKNINLSGLESNLKGGLEIDLGNGAIAGSAEGFVDLGILSAFAPEYRGAGKFSLDLDFQGSLANPNVVGKAVIEQGRVRWLGFPQTAEQIGVSVVFEGPRARIERLHALVGGGEIRGGGEFWTNAAGIGGYNLNISAAGVRISWPEDFEGVYEGDFVLSGGADEAVVQGRAQMLRGIYDKEFDLAGALGSGTREYASDDTQSIPENVLLDVDIAADGGLWLRNDMAEIESGFNLHIGGNLRRPELTGRLWMHEGGELEFRDITYRIVSGSLNFVELDRINPYLIMRAETSVGVHEVYLRVEGTLDSFEYELTSMPALSQQDIIALLMTGRTLQELTTEGRGGGADFTGDLAANYFAGALTGKFEKQLERLLGLDRVRINPMLVQGSADPTTRITIGEKVSEDLSVIFSSDVGSTERQLYQVEWKASPRHTFTAERDTTGGIGGDYLYRDRYWWRKRPRERDVAEPASKIPEEMGERGESVVHSVRLDGVTAEQDVVLRRRIPLGEGDPFRRSKMFAGIEAIRRYFIRQGKILARVTAETSAAGGDEASIDLLYRVDPGPEMDVTFEGAEKKDRRRIRALLEELWAESLFYEDLYADSERLIREYYQARGYYAVDVRHRLEGDLDGRRIVFEIDRGKPVRVEKVQILGAQHVPEERIRRQILTGAGSLFSRNLLDPRILEQDLTAIRNLYLDSGYLRADISKPKIRLSSSADSAVVSIVIEEGPLFTIGEIIFASDLPFDRKQLLAWCGLRSGELFSPARLVEASGGLRSGFDREGYPDARVSRAVEIDGERVRIRFSVEPGGFKRVGRIEISGNLLTKERSILRELELREGDLISREKLLRSQHRLYKLGLFRNVRMSYSPIETKDGTSQRLLVSVDEAPPLSLSLGVGYDTEAGARARFSTAHDNLGGRARTIAIQGHFSEILQRAQIVGTEPRLLGRKLPALANLFWEHSEETDFTVERRSTALRVDRELNSKWSGYLRYNWQKVDLSDVRDEVALQEEKLENIKLGDIGVTLVRSTRDDPIMPSDGTLFSLSTRLFSEVLLSDESFLKTTLAASWIHTFPNNSSFATGARLGLSEPFGSSDQVPLSERFFAGGDSTLRGFPRDGVAPVGEEGIVGGEALLLLNQEYRFPILGSLKGVLFYDAGNLYVTLEDLDPLDLRHVLGVGLRYELPIGPLRVEYGRKLDRQEGESSGELFLAIGAAF
jgi:outer membrane protein insertion porin family